MRPDGAFRPGALAYPQFIRSSYPSAHRARHRLEPGTVFAQSDPVHIATPEHTGAAQAALDQLAIRLEAIQREANARAIGVAVHDFETAATLGFNADRWFHAASTIKVAILAGVYA